MRRLSAVAILALGALVTEAILRAAEEPPAWAYNAQPPPPAGAPPAQPAPVDESPRHLAGSSGAFTLTQVRDVFGPADWYPGDHPAMPDVVAHGRRPEVRACGLCHYPNGKGRPENAGVVGSARRVLHADDGRLQERRAQERRAEEGQHEHHDCDSQRAMTDDEMKGAAEYFGAMKWTPWIKVVETDTVPKTRIQGGMFLKLEGNETEPIGQRIIETPEDTRTHRASRCAIGIHRVRAGGQHQEGRSAGQERRQRQDHACGTCHGADLKGLGPVPGLAGRSPSHTVRQLYDMQQGARKGLWTELMMPVVAKLTNDDLLAIGAYTASLAP